MTKNQMEIICSAFVQACDARKDFTTLDPASPYLLHFIALGWVQSVYVWKTTGLNPELSLTSIGVDVYNILNTKVEV